MKKSLFVPTVLTFFIFFILMCFVSAFDCGYAGTPSVRIGFFHLNTAVNTMFPYNILFCRILGFILLFSYLIALLSALYGLFCVLRYGISYDDAMIFSPCSVFLILELLNRFFTSFPINFSPYMEGTLNSSFPAYLVLVPVGVLEAQCVSLRYFFPNTGKLRVLFILVFSLLIVSVPVFAILSGMYWTTDIAGAMLLSSAVVLLFCWGSLSFDSVLEA